MKEGDIVQFFEIHPNARHSFHRGEWGLIIDVDKYTAIVMSACGSIDEWDLDELIVVDST